MSSTGSFDLAIDLCALPSCRYAATGLCDHRAMRLLSYATTGLCDYWVTRLLSYATTELCDYRVMRQLSYVTTELCDYWATRLLSYAATWPWEVWEGMIGLVKDRFEGYKPSCSYLSCSDSNIAWVNRFCSCSLAKLIHNCSKLFVRKS